MRVQRVIMFLAGTVNGYGLARGWSLLSMLLLGGGLYMAGWLIASSSAPTP